MPTGNRSPIVQPVASGSFWHTGRGEWRHYRYSANVQKVYVSYDASKFVIIFY